MKPIPPNPARTVAHATVVRKVEQDVIREWTCHECGTHHDRDINAAKNILALGHQRLAGGILAL